MLVNHVSYTLRVFILCVNMFILFIFYVHTKHIVEFNYKIYKFDKRTMFIVLLIFISKCNQVFYYFLNLWRRNVNRFYDVIHLALI